MSLSILGITLHEFDVGLTDLTLAIFCAYWLIILIKRQAGTNAKIIFFGLITSSFFGSIFHFFFPLKAETGNGFIVWSVVAFSIGLIIFGMLRLIIGNPEIKKTVAILIPYVYVAVYLIYFFFISYSFPSIILFYGPVVALLGITCLVKLFRGEWQYISLLFGVIATFVAAGIQILRIDLHPIYFNFNSLYHIIQLIGLYYFYVFFKTENSYRDARLIN